MRENEKNCRLTVLVTFLGLRLKNNLQFRGRYIKSSFSLRAGSLFGGNVNILLLNSLSAEGAIPRVPKARVRGRSELAPSALEEFNIHVAPAREPARRLKTPTSVKLKKKSRPQSCLMNCLLNFLTKKLKQKKTPNQQLRLMSTI